MNVGDDKQEWLTLLHLIATHRPAHLQHEHTTILLRIGDVMPVKSMEGAGNVPCPEVCRKDKRQLKDGYLVPANNQFLALNPTTKYSIVPAKGRALL